MLYYVMFIKEIIKKNFTSDKTFTYHRLVEAVRTPRGPRQRIILNLGKLDLPREDWKTLANRIEEIFSGQQTLLITPPHIESLAHYYAGMLRRKEMQSVPVSEQSDWEKVDLNSLSQSEVRTIGAESVAWDAFMRLGFPHILSDLGFSQEQVHKTALLVVGRLVHPASERETAHWGRGISALQELLGADFQHLSNNALYRTSDQLVKHRDEIEKGLTERERDIFNLGEKIILYDLTNTYLTGNGRHSHIARRGRSKQKRNDCPLLTLALVLDNEGFPKASRVLEGNISEPGTLEGFLQNLKSEPRDQLSLLTEPATLVFDAGVGTRENLDLIRREGLHYVTVRRQRSGEIPEEGLTVIKEDKDSTVKVRRLDGEGETILYCQSTARARKEESMKASFQKHFEEGLQAISDSLSRKRGHKAYGRVMERLGRLKERYPTIAQFYNVEVHEERGRVTRMEWGIDREKEIETRFSGSYYIRSSRTDLDEKELWSLYMMLTQIEESFRTLKSELGLRPVRHHKDPRMEGHLFISVLAYHLLAGIQRELKQKGISYRWETIRNRLSTQTRVTASLTNDKGERIHIRQTTDPEPFHFEIYRALGLPLKPLKAKRLRA
jgi:transposase